MESHQSLEQFHYDCHNTLHSLAVLACATLLLASPASGLTLEGSSSSYAQLAKWFHTGNRY